MPRVLVCVDEVPAGDGACAHQVWMEVNTIPPLPTVEQATDVGWAIFLGLATLGALRGILKPRDGEG